VGDSSRVAVIKSLKHLVKKETADFWAESPECNIVIELAIINNFHHDVGDWYLAAVCLDLEGVMFERDDLYDVFVL
jgi:hypothetical protein